MDSRIKVLLTALCLMCAPAYIYSDGRLLVNMTLVRNASLVGAYCLDGSLPAYHLHRGFGAGVNNWLLQFEVAVVVILSAFSPFLSFVVYFITVVFPFLFGSLTVLLLKYYGVYIKIFPSFRVLSYVRKSYRVRITKIESYS